MIVARPRCTYPQMPVSLARLVSIDLLRFFVAAGRRMSITEAADDLCLTPSAVSRQIRQLETRLGTKLFIRGHRSIAFTQDGERLFRSADAAVQQLQDVLGELSPSMSLRPVMLSATIGVTGLWLLPRLSRLQRSHSGVDLRISANNKVLDLRDDGIDLAIRYAPPTRVPEGAIRLFGEEVLPVARPGLVNATLRSARSLGRVDLIEFDDPQHPWLQWREWLAARGWAVAKPRGTLHFNQYDQVIQAALAGHGVALGRLALVRDLITQRRLQIVGTTGSAVPTDHAYWLLQRDPRPRSAVRLVANWICAEATGS
jgi:LysR family transcriptional regulator, glycine cleavage system transcriptional activator